MHKSFKKDLDNIKKEIKKVIVGQDKVVEGLLRALLANGHVLVEGVPGIAKTLLIRALGQVTGTTINRIQFTVDLLPTDIIGMTTYEEKLKEYTIVKGPIFANFIIADEINRAPPKTQSALLEAMQEKQVTISGKTFPLPKPFFVMANKNPIESSGVYSLPEAQLDRFLFKINMGYPEKHELQQIMETNTSIKSFEDYNLKPVITSGKIIEMQNEVQKIKYSALIKDYITDLVHATKVPKEFGISLGDYIEWAASPRAAISLFISAKADAFLRGKDYITPNNIKNVAYDVLRHRILLNYKADAEGIKTEDIIKEILHKVKIP